MSNTITYSYLAKNLADMIFDSISKKSLSKEKELIGIIDGKKRTELLIFEMCSVVYSVLSVFNNYDEGEKLLDEFDSQIYKVEYNSKKEQMESFLKLKHDRYLVYQKILSSDDEMKYHNLGKQFVGYFLDKDINDPIIYENLPLSLWSAGMFNASFVSVTGLLKEILDNFNLID